MVITCSSKDFPLGTLGYGIIWLILAVSSVVLIEPAPYDVLGLALLPLLFVFGLRIPPGFSVGFFCIVTYVVGNGISGFFATSFAEAFSYLLITAYLSLTFLIFACVSYHRPMQSLKVIMSGYLVAALATAVFGIITYFGMIPHSEQYLRFGSRAQGLFKDANVFGPFLVAPILYLIARTIDAKFRTAILYLAVVLVLAFGLFLSFSRGAWGSLALSFMIFLGLSLLATRSPQEKSRLMLYGTAVLVLAVIGIAIALSMHKISALFQVRAELFQDYDTGAQGRFAMQRQALALASRLPFGLGVGQWEHTFPEDPHNVYLKLIATGGWITGFAYYTLVIASVWRGFKFCFRSWEGQLVYIALYAAFVATVLEGAIIDTDHWRHFYLLMGLVWGPSLAIQPARQTAAKARWSRSAPLPSGHYRTGTGPQP